MRHTGRSRAAVLALLMVIVAACGSATATGAPPASDAPPATGSPQASGPVAEAELPAPDFAWAFDGDGKASAGGIDVEFLGAYESSADAVAFDGYTGHGMAAEGLVDTTKSFTLSVWANYAKAQRQSAVLGVLGDDSYAAALAVGGKTADITGIEYAVQVQTAPVRAGNRWTHVAGVYDSDAGVIRLYVDGEPVGEAATGAPFSAKGPLTIGRGQYDGGPGNFWPGAIDSVAVYQSVLTDAQIAAIYESSRPSSSPPPLPAPDPATYANGLLNGTWDFVLDDEGAQLLLEDYADFVDSADEVTVRLGFDDHEWWEGVLFDGELILHDGVPEGAGGTFIIDGNNLITTESEGDGVSTWTLADNRLTLELVEFCPAGDPQQPCERTDPLAPEWKLPITIFNHTFTKSGDDPSY
jgi:hypothetical protein